MNYIISTLAKVENVKNCPMATRTLAIELDFLKKSKVLKQMHVHFAFLILRVHLKISFVTAWVLGTPISFPFLR